MLDNECSSIFRSVVIIFVISDYYPDGYLLLKHILTVKIEVYASTHCRIEYIFQEKFGVPFSVVSGVAQKKCVFQVLNKIAFLSHA